MANQIIKYSCSQLAGVEISCLMVDGSPWFKAKDVVTILGYVKTKQAVSINVDDEDKMQLKDLVCMLHGTVDRTMDASDQNIMFINESGLYSVILRSNKAEAKIFKSWVTSEVLPSIRKTGSYSTKPAIEAPLVGNQIRLLNETHLHYKVVDLIRNKFPDLMLVPGLGEYQSTSQLRCDAYRKGYSGGQPDIIILNRTDKYNGFALELKTPKGNGEIRDNQLNYLNNLEQNLKYKSLLSDDYDEIVIELTNYYNDLRYPCTCCSKVFKSKNTLDGHMKAFHAK